MHQKVDNHAFALKVFVQKAKWIRVDGFMFFTDLPLSSSVN